jgi:HPt (histidine-containing phosphotransfer) domain-containing protein
MSDSVAVYDRNQAIGIAGDNPSIADELLSLMLQELPMQIERLELAYADGELEELRRIAHQLHGSASYCAACALKAATLDLEAAILESRNDRVPAAFDRLITEIHRLLTYCETRPAGKESQ